MLPNEILDRIFLMSDSEDIKNWESYERLNRNTFLKKKDKNQWCAVKNNNKIGIDYLCTNQKFLDVAFRCAIRENNLEMVKYTVDKGANISAENHFALIFACRSLNADLVEYILNLYSDDETNSFKESFFHTFFY